MGPWDSLIRRLSFGVTMLMLLGLRWQFYPASRTQVPRGYHLGDVLRWAVGSSVLSSLMYGAFGYVFGTGDVWDAMLYGVGIGVTVILGGILFRWLERRGT